MKVRNIKSALARAASWLSWQLDHRPRQTGNRIPVLIYHRVLPEYLEGDKPIYSILPEQFESQMAFIQAEGFESLSLQEYAEIARGLRPPAARSVLITFDDGYADSFSLAWPIAAKYGVKINLFICTQLVGRAGPIVMGPDGYRTPADARWPGEAGARVQSHLGKFPELWRPLTWEELGAMQDSGVQLGFHSHRHRNLALLTPEEIAADTAAGMAIWERQRGYRPPFYALPYGGYESYTPRVIEALQRSGLEFIFAAHLGRTRLPAAPQVFPRLPLYQEDSVAVFQRKIFGAYDWFGPIQRLEQAVRVAAQKIRPASQPSP